MRKIFLRFFKIGLIIILVGFFCPVSCNMNGFQLVRYSLNSPDLFFMVGIPFIIIFAFSVMSLIYRKSKDELNKNVKGMLLLFLPNVLAAAWLFFCARGDDKEGVKDSLVSLNYGTWIMIVGYVWSLISLICVSLCKSKEKQIIEIAENTSLADDIRRFCLEKKIGPARKSNVKTITIHSEEIHNELKLKNRFPAVCSAISGNKFLDMANLKILSEQGEKPSRKYSVTYEIL